MIVCVNDMGEGGRGGGGCDWVIFFIFFVFVLEDREEGCWQDWFLL